MNANTERYHWCCRVPVHVVPPWSLEPRSVRLVGLWLAPIVVHVRGICHATAHCGSDNDPANLFWQAWPSGILQQLLATPVMPGCGKCRRRLPSGLCSADDRRIVGLDRTCPDRRPAGGRVSSRRPSPAPRRAGQRLARSGGLAIPIALGAAGPGQAETGRLHPGNEQAGPAGRNRQSRSQARTAPL